MRGQLVDLWKRREYASMVKVMSPLEEHLLPSEAKKLEIARRNLKK
jgi:hypothetical protein